MKKLELYFFPECPYCQIVLQALKETGLESVVTYHNTRENPADRQKLINDTGKSQVPCLYIDDKPMHESRDIANWLHGYAKEIKSAKGN